MIEGLDGVVSITDVLLVWVDSVAGHDHRLKLLLERAKENNLKLNKNSCFIRTKEIKYTGLKPDEENVRAATQLPDPQKTKELLRLMGMIQYLIEFIPNLSDIRVPFRKLSKVTRSGSGKKHKRGVLSILNSWSQMLQP